MADSERCAVCNVIETKRGGMSRLFIEGRSLLLCRTHAATVVSEMPATFDQLRALFVGASIRSGQGLERRSPIPRRANDDRRVFPPRPEGRRMSPGRRATDTRGSGNRTA